jgi:hypothetical protein
MSINFQRSLLKTKRFIFFAAIFLVLSSAAQTRAGCGGGQNAESQWIEQTLRIWEKTRREALRLPAERLPWMVLFDETCVYHVNPDAAVIRLDPQTRIPFNRKIADVYLIEHDGKITLPDKQSIPARLLSFAAAYDDGRKSFFVSAMPSVWRAAPHLKEEKNLDALVRSVFMHEMTHTLHRNFYARLDALEKQLTNVKNFDDDIIQNTFGQRDDFRKAYENEHALLYQTVAEQDLGRQRGLAKAALAMIRARRQQFFTEKEAVYAEIEEIFLTMEGAANWTAYQAARGQGLSEAEALKLIRRGGKFWSQEEGLALFLVIDRLLPRWQKKAFGKSATVTDLLAEAVR